MKSIRDLEKTDLKKDFENVTFRTFDYKEMFEYELLDLEQSKVELVKEYINKINKDKDYYLYYRGDLFKRFGKSFDEIVNHSLNKLFIVGHKGMSFYNTEIEEGYYNNFSVDNSGEIKTLIRKIKDKFPNFSEDKLKGYPADRQLELLYSIIHNLGEENMEADKRCSPFVSVTVGDNNFDVAEIFCGIKKVKSKRGYGFIILGFEKVGEYYIDSEILREFGLQLEEIIDMEQEILIKNVLWPSNIIGVFILKDDEKFFVVNPWLLYTLETYPQRESYLIYVDQKDFSELSKRLGYRQYGYRPYDS